MKLKSKIILSVLSLALFLMCAGNAEARKEESSYETLSPSEMADPIEPVNRAIFGFNNILDRMLIEPVSRGYNTVLPTPVKDSVQSFMRNLKSPLTLANNILQGKIGDAGVTTIRFLINSTIGIIGLVDVADAQGFPYKAADFGQTLGVWGIGDGFYLVLPVLGPSSLRDTVGLAGDIYADPVRIVTSNRDQDWIYYTRGGIQAIDTRSRMIKTIDDLRRNSLDYYAAVRSAYTQKRQNMIHGEKQKQGSSAYDEFK